MIPISDAEHKAARFPIINIILIAINVYVFFLELTTTNPDAFIMQYALVPANIDFSNIYSLYPFVTSMFLHGGFLHIISNMLFLWVFGDNVEGHFPPLTYLFVYVFSGIVGSFAQYILSPTSNIPMLGASGAVAGALGAYFVLFPHHKIKTLIPIFGFFTFVNISALFMIGYWIVLQIIAGSGALAITSGEETGGVAYFAHIGGFVTGLVYAKLFRGKVRPQHHIEG